MRTQASTSSSSRSTAGAEEGSRSKSEPKAAEGQRRAGEKAEGDSRDWVRRPLHALPSAPGQRLTPLRELPAKISMQTPAEHRVERQLCDAQSSARRDYTWSSTVPNGRSRYYCLWHTADYHAELLCPWAGHRPPAPPFGCSVYLRSLPSLAVACMRWLLQCFIGLYLLSQANAFSCAAAMTG